LIFYGQLRYGRAAPRYEATERSVSVTIPGGTGAASSLLRSELELHGAGGIDRSGLAECGERAIAVEVTDGGGGVRLAIRARIRITKRAGPDELEPQLLPGLT